MLVEFNLAEICQKKKEISKEKIEWPIKLVFFWRRKFLLNLMKNFVYLKPITEQNCKICFSKTV